MGVETGEPDQNLMHLPVLPLARYRLRFESSGRGGLPAYPGSAWRGALGHALKKTVCVTSLDSCPPCLLYRSCPYPYIFETPPPLGARKMRRYTLWQHEVENDFESCIERITMAVQGNRWNKDET